jgi:hypothetical protein
MPHSRYGFLELPLSELASVKAGEWLSTARRTDGPGVMQQGVLRGFEWPEEAPQDISDARVKRRWAPELARLPIPTQTIAYFGEGDQPFRGW